MSNLENTIEQVIAEAAKPLPKAKADSSPDKDAPVHSTDAASKAAGATKKAKAPGGDKASEKGSEVSDGKTKKEKTKGKAVNQEEVEDDSETPSLQEMSKADLLKAAVASLKEKDVKQLQSIVKELNGDDEDEDDEDDDEEKSESLSRNALIRKVVESLKDKSVTEIRDFMEQDDEDEDDEDDDEDDDDDEVDEGKLPPALQKAIDAKKGKGDDDEDDDEDDETESKSKKESYEVDMSDDIEALVADEDLSEEFKTKAKTIFEAAVSTKVKEQIDEIESKYEETTKEAIEEIKEDLTTKVDSYLGYVAESWVEENELAIERGLKSELTEGFINGLKDLFEEHYVEVPEDKFDVVEELAGRLDDTEDKLNDEVANNITMSQIVEELKREKIVREAGNGLADSEVEKLKELTEDIDFEDEEKFQEKVSTLREAYFTGKKIEAVSDDVNVANSDADFTVPNVETTGPMSAYTAAISKFAKLEE